MLARARSKYHRRCKLQPRITTDYDNILRRTLHVVGTTGYLLDSSDNYWGINIHFERAADVNTCKVVVTLASFGFRQSVGTPTHELGGIFDVIVAPSDHPPEDVVVDDVGLSDHMLVSWSVKLAPPLPVYVRTTRRTWRTFKTRTSSAG